MSVTSAEARSGRPVPVPLYHLGARQAAALAGLTPAAVRTAARTSRLPHQRVRGGQMRFHPTDIEAFRLAQTKEPTS